MHCIINFLHSKVVYQLISTIFLPFLSICFIISVLAIGVNVSKYQKYINSKATTLTVIPGIRNDLSDYLENQRNIDEIDNHKWFVDFQNKAVKTSSPENDLLVLSDFLTEFNNKTPKRLTLEKANQLIYTNLRLNSFFICNQFNLILKNNYHLFLSRFY